MSVCHCVTVSLCHCVTVSLCHCATVSLSHCATLTADIELPLKRGQTAMPAATAARSTTTRRGSGLLPCTAARRRRRTRGVLEYYRTFILEETLIDRYAFIDNFFFLGDVIADC